MIPIDGFRSAGVSVCDLRWRQAQPALRRQLLQPARFDFEQIERAIGERGTDLGEIGLPAPQPAAQDGRVELGVVDHVIETAIGRISLN